MNPQYRNVDQTGLLRLDAELEAAGFTDEACRRFGVEYPKELAAMRRRAMLRPVAVNGNRTLGRRMGYFETRLRDGTLGYFQRRTDDCVQASIATLTQIPMPEVPDLRISKRIEDGNTYDEIGHDVKQQLDVWLNKHGFAMTRHDRIPTNAERWIGVVPLSDSGWSDHCVVMSGTDVVWDTTHQLPPNKSEPMARLSFTLENMAYGITIDRRA